MNCKVLIWGTGKNSKCIFKLITKIRKDINVIGFVEKEVKKDYFLNYRVFRIDDDFINSDDLVMIITPLYWIDNIVQYINKDRFYKIFINLLTNMNDEYKNSKYNENDILEYSYYFNGQSRENWYSVMDLITAKSGDRIKKTLNSEKMQYLEFVKLYKGDVVIDGGGAHDHITEIFSKLVGSTGKVYSFDPFYGSNEIIRGNTVMYNMGLWDKEDILVFNNTQDASASFLEATDISNQQHINVINIDTFCKKVNSYISFIKLDVEGAEINVLKGAVDTIKKYKPKLAIAVYHTFNDFFNIINFLEELNIGYMYFFNCYSKGYSESILYATTNENDIIF